MTTAAAPAPENASPAAMAENALRLAKAGQLAESQKLFQAVVNASPQDADSWANLGTVNCLLKDIEGGIDCFREALRIQPNDPPTKQNLVSALGMKLDRTVGSAQQPARVQLLREILSVAMNDFPARINLHDSLWATRSPAVLSDLSQSLQPEDIGKKVLITCMPKSGSSWLFSVMKELTGFPEDRYTQGFLQNEQEIFLPRVVETARENGVIQQHFRATVPNVHVLQGFGLRPIVLVRNVFDALVSMRDFYNQGAIVNTFHYADWDLMDEDTRLDLITETIAPWYVQFYASWELVRMEKRIEMLPLRYEDMMADKAGSLKSVAEFCGVHIDPDAIESTIARLSEEKRRVRFNKGVAGRGEEIFSAAQKDRIRALTRFYPSVDFSPVGL